MSLISNQAVSFHSRHVNIATSLIYSSQSVARVGHRRPGQSAHAHREHEAIPARHRRGCKRMGKPRPGGRGHHLPAQRRDGRAGGVHQSQCSTSCAASTSSVSSSSALPASSRTRPNEPLVKHCLNYLRQNDPMSLGFVPRETSGTLSVLTRSMSPTSGRARTGAKCTMRRRVSNVIKHRSLLETTEGEYFTIMLRFSFYVLIYSGKSSIIMPSA